MERFNIMVKFIREYLDSDGMIFKICLHCSLLEPFSLFVLFKHHYTAQTSEFYHFEIKPPHCKTMSVNM